MGRSRGVQQEPPSDPLVVHLLENRSSKQTFENVAQCIYSLFLCKSSYALMSLEPTPNIRRNMISIHLASESAMYEGIFNEC